MTCGPHMLTEQDGSCQHATSTKTTVNSVEGVKLHRFNSWESRYLILPLKNTNRTELMEANLGVLPGPLSFGSKAYSYPWELHSLILYFFFLQCNSLLNHFPSVDNIQFIFLLI